MIGIDLETYRPSRFLQVLDTMSHGLVHLIGDGKHYKTGTYAQWFEVCPTLRTRPKAFIGLPDVSFLPAYLNARVIPSIKYLRPGEVGVLDDVTRLYPSRVKNPELQEVIPQISHNGNLIITTGQNSQNRDIGFDRDQTVYDCHKFMSSKNITNERPESQLHCYVGSSQINRFSEYLGCYKGYLTYIPDFEEVLYLPEPAPWYDERLSHALRGNILKGVSV